MTRALLSVPALLLLCAVIAASGDDVPRRLSETGLYVPGQPGGVAPENRPFSPQYPLWTDGASKTRWVYLPPGTTIDASDPNRWKFPVGTRFWKEFAFGGRRVETRMIWRTSPTRWVYATYLWNADGTDAVLAPESGVPQAAEIAPGRWHGVPAVTDCAACHGAGEPTPLGFNALQLSIDRDPLAIHGEPLRPGMLTVRTLVEEGRLRDASARDLLALPPRIRTDNPSTRAMLGYMLANCGTCHNGRGETAALGPTLTYEDVLADGDAVARALVGHPTRWQVPGVPEGESTLVDPEHIEQSAILVRMRSRRPSSQMPPLGTVMRDTVALERMTTWLTHDLTRPR